MKFVGKVLSITLLLAVSVKADLDLKTLVPWVAPIALGEACYQYNKDMKRRSGTENPDKVEKAVKDITTSVAGGALMSALKREEVSFTNITVNTIKSYLALKISQHQSVNDALKKIPGVRGVLCDDAECNKAMTPGAITRHAATLYVVDKIWTASGINTLVTPTLMTPATK